MKEAYLTIDDCPSVDFKIKLDFLLEQNIPAVIFCEGRFIEQRPMDILYAIENNFLIGNHAYNHPFFSDCSLEKCFSEIKRTDEIIDYLYEKSEIKRPYKVFRFPYGDKGDLRLGKNWENYLTEEGLSRKEAIQGYLRDLGYSKPSFPKVTYEWYKNRGLDNDVDWYWTYDCKEYMTFGKRENNTLDSLEKVISRMDKNEPEDCLGLNYIGSEDIILVHDHQQTTDYFKSIINKLQTKVKFKSI